ncbi:MAG TPA: M55 family metallopeptidase [Spirochaetota bacterium]|nr:M55 family metallopeptidase [Spirochaetota bacterium]
MSGRNVLLIADIEGSSGCFDYEGSSFKTEKWASACADMTKDVDAVVRALFNAGARSVTVKDFHRTGYNLFTNLIDPRARIVSGYRNGPVPGIGDPTGHDTAMFIGMHAPSGSGGFLAHTMTHRITSVRANGTPVSELELFAGSLAPFGIRPVFFSGCPVACDHANNAVPGMTICPIDKSSASFDMKSWREHCAESAAESLRNTAAFPYNPEGPFEIEISFRGGISEALSIARKWKLKQSADHVIFSVSCMPELFNRLIDIAYFTPVTRAVAPFALPLYNIYGRAGILWAHKKLYAARNS